MLDIKNLLVNKRGSEYLSFSEFYKSINPYKNINVNSEFKDAVEKYLKQNQEHTLRKLKDADGNYIEGICAWNTLNNIDRSVLVLQKVLFSEYSVISFRHPKEGSQAVPSRELENSDMAKSLSNSIEELGMDKALNSVPALIGYKYKNTIVIVEGARRLAAMHHLEVPYAYIWLEEIDDNGNCYNRHYYSGTSTDKIIKEELSQFANIPDHRVVPTYGFERKYFYPDISRQVGALIKYVLNQDTEELRKIAGQIQQVKEDIPKV